MAAKEITKRVGKGEAEIAQALIDSDHQDSDMLQDIFRIEYRATKKTPSIIDAEIDIAFKPANVGDNMKVVSIGFEEPWENLPDQVRSDFIRKGGDTQIYVVYGKKKS